MRTNTNVVSAIRLGGEFKHSGLTATWLLPQQVCEGVLNVLFLFCCNFDSSGNTKVTPTEFVYAYLFSQFYSYDLQMSFLAFRCAVSSLMLNVYSFKNCLS